ncbi:MAG TPA: SDR family oxidoreductase [Thermoanaerobaculia bacterium]|nr:SDR family oxidoreductase [Thermoanaerobaculia bacterium]
MKTALITGPARGIGAAVARLLAARGMRLALVGLEPERLAALANELGPGHVWIECDVTDGAAMERAVAQSVEALGGLDVVVANAGIAAHGTVAVMPMKAMARVAQVNLIGVLNTVGATIKHVLDRRGYFLLVSSAAAIAPAPGLAAYCATKSGVEQFGNALRLEVAHHGVDVGVAYPSWTDTDLVRDAQQGSSTFNRMVRNLPGPFGKITSLDECAASIADCIAHRRRKVFIPKSLGTFAALRQLLTSPLGEWLAKRDARKLVPALEKDVKESGQYFGANSVER